MMIEPERQQAVLAHARGLMKRASYDEAISYLRQACREQPDGEYQKLLARCRHQAYVAQPPESERTGDLLTEEDVFAEIDGIPEINAEHLSARTLAAGIRHHGALLVRGLLDPSCVMGLVAGIDQALQACQDWRNDPCEASETAWYSRLPLGDACEIAGGRDWGESAGGVWTADSPRMLYELMELFEANGLLSTITDYFGERPMLSVGKSTLRRVPATQSVADWHQDGAFMGSDIRSVNVWLSLSHCGEDASGLEFLPRRVPVVLPTGSHGARLSWTVGPGMVGETAVGVSTVSPVFGPGDALIFDHFFLHRTGVPPGISKPRYAIESWFFAPSAYPAKQVPLRF